YVLCALPKMGFAGVNVTLPHKEHARRLVDRCDDAAVAIGAVNTIVIDTHGALAGRNTDAQGFWAHLVDASGRAEWSGARALLLGAGGAARAALWALRRAGVDVAIANRSGARAHALASEFAADAVAWPETPAALGGFDLLVNATSLGMAGQPPLAIDLSAMADTAVVYDLVYTPLATPLLHAAQARGLVAVDGLGMLIHQAAPAFAAWFGIVPAVDAAVRRHLMAALAP
ncbi:MAG: shikimate dehydrogenase, partial [Alphaproteobacteria bacterium]